MLLKLSESLDGYYFVRLLNKEGEKSFKNHQIVMMAFHNIFPSKGLIIDHINQNRKDNNVSNLRIVTHRENALNITRAPNKRDEIAQYSLDGKHIKTWDSTDQIEIELGFLKIGILACCLGTIKSSHGFRWKNLNRLDDFTDFVKLPVIDGKIFSKYKINREGVIIDKCNKKMRYDDDDGYDRCSLVSDDGSKPKITVHRVVAMTFLKNPHGYNVVNHKNKDKKDNNVSNLEWCNTQYNATHGCGKPVEKIDPNTDAILDTFVSIAEATRSLGKKDGSGISKVCKGKQTLAFGLKWRFSELSVEEVLRQRALANV